MARVTGDKELRRALRSVSTAPTGKVLDAICARALTPMRDSMDAGAPRPSLKGTATIAKKEGRGTAFRVFWIAFKGMGLRVAHLVEFGTAPHSLARGASRRYGILQDRPPFHPGTPAEPFARPAYESQKEATVSTLSGGIWDAITSTVRGVKT